HYKTLQQPSLESAFTKYADKKAADTEPALTGVHYSFFDEAVFPDYPKRTVKHIASPHKKSACKRLNMFLRWMVRSNAKGVDFGIWKQLKPSQLVCPVDLHVARVARHFGLLQRPNRDWLAAVELTKHLKMLDPKD